MELDFRQLPPEVRLALRPIMTQFNREFCAAEGNHGRYRSAHEAYGVLAEEFREYETEVFLKAERRDKTRMRAELIQVAVVAIRAILSMEGR